MGAADFSTHIRLEGSTEELFEMLKIIKHYATEKKKQYGQKKDCPYLLSVFIGRFQVEGLAPKIDAMTDEELLEFTKERKGVVLVDASGPYGRFWSLQQMTLFHEMAEAAPQAKFVGSISGFDPGGVHATECILENGLLTCKYSSIDHEFDEEDEDWDDEEWDEDEEERPVEPNWDTIIIYDPVAKKNVNTKNKNKERYKKI